MKIRNNFKHTIAASYIGYITQAVVNNFAPLLFVTFRHQFKIDLKLITLLVTINFIVQLIVDLIAAKYVDKIGYRACVVAAHIFAAAGLVGLGILPEIFPSAFGGLVCAVVLYAIGGGLTEVLISPIVEACPTDSKSAAMSLLHSFYCWGSVGVVAISTLLFSTFGIEHWKIIACLWAIIPALNAVYFCFVPIAKITEDGEEMSVRELFKMKTFYVLALLMLCAGASELAMSQWASTFAESALHVSKAVGDIAGPCFFALLMGFSRVLHAKLADKIDLKKYMTGCAMLCIVVYAVAVFSPYAVLGLAGCGICGFSVGVMWPGTFSIATKSCPNGSTALFAFLALAGDMGCSAGPTLVGMVSGAFDDNLKSGLAFAVIFPVLMIFGLWLLGRINGKAKI